MINIIVAIYCIVDDLLKAIEHSDDCRRTMIDAEVLTTAIVASRFFGSNHTQACQYMEDQGLVPNMLEKSRFNRRLHAVAELLYDLQPTYRSDVNASQSDNRISARFISCASV